MDHANTQPLRLILTSTSSRDEAERIARHLVESWLAACVKIVAGVQSIYRWEDAVESATECVLLIKTRTQHVAAVEQAICGLHSYEVPEFLVLPIESSSESYLRWLIANLQ